MSARSGASPSDVLSSPASATQLLWARVKGGLLGLILSLVIGFSIVLLAFTLPLPALVAMTAWILGPYVHAIVRWKSEAPIRARAIGFALGHTVAVVVVWFAMRQFFAGLDVGIGGG